MICKATIKVDSLVVKAVFQKAVNDLGARGVIGVIGCVEGVEEVCLRDVYLPKLHLRVTRTIPMEIAATTITLMQPTNITMEFA